ncbi:MAG: DUF4382 domain-containing protein [Gemmatimonadales bacterium]
MAIAGAGVMACDSGGGPTLLSSETGTVNVLLTDAPFPFAEVQRVDVFVVRIDGALVDVDPLEMEDESDSTSWKTLASPNASVNLLDLRNGKTANLGVATLPVGTYKSFRMIIDTDQSSVTLNDNSKPDIKWPSAGKHGIKINLDEPFVVGPGTTNLLIDFDIGRSFVMRGNSIKNNGLLFKPVIHATTQQSTGSIAGTVHGDNATGPVIPGATIEVLKNGTTLTDTDPSRIVRTGVTDAAGAYTLAFVSPGTYVVRATPTVASGYKPALLPGTVVVTAGNAITGQVIVVTK